MHHLNLRGRAGAIAMFLMPLFQLCMSATIRTDFQGTMRVLSLRLRTEMQAYENAYDNAVPDRLL